MRAALAAEFAALTGQLERLVSEEPVSEETKHTSETPRLPDSPLVMLADLLGLSPTERTILTLTAGAHGKDFFSREGTVVWLEQFGRNWAWLAGIALITADLALPIPGTVVMAALGYVYGPWLGGAIGAAGSILSGLLAYGICRRVGRASSSTPASARCRPTTSG